MAPRIEGPGSTLIPGLADSFDPASTATVQLGESDLGQVAARLGVDKDNLMLANPQIKDPSKLTVGQDIHLPATSCKAHSDDTAQTGVTTRKSTPSGSRFCGDPFDANAMKEKLDQSQGGNINPDGSPKYSNVHLPPDEQAIKDKGGDLALKAYQRFKQVQTDLQRKLHDLKKPEIMEKIKTIDQLEEGAAKTRDPLERNAMLHRADEMRQDPDVKYELMLRDLERRQQEATNKAIENIN